MTIVYCTTNLKNGKKYIGSHSLNKKSYLGSGVNLIKAIKKYGKENFIRQILWEGPSEFKYELEEYWISYFNAAKNPMFYNATEKGVGMPAGTKRDNLDWEEISKKRVANTDYSWAKDFNWSKRNIDQSWKEGYDWSKKVANTDYSYLKDKEFQQKRVANTNWEEQSRKRTANTDYKAKAEKCKKPILQYDLNGNFIKEWPSNKDVQNELNIYPTSCLRGKNKQIGGFMWKYKTESYLLKIEPYSNKRNYPKNRKRKSND
jgi:hypothetical protein